MAVPARAMTTTAAATHASDRRPVIGARRPGRAR
jgi:hypothetical protein